MMFWRLAGHADGRHGACKIADPPIQTPAWVVVTERVTAPLAARSAPGFTG